MYLFGEIFNSGARTAESDRIAMGATDAQLPALCAKGNLLACELAKIPPPSAAKEADMAAQRDAQKKQEDAHTARKLTQVGLNPRIAEAVKKGQPIIYAKDRAEAIRIVTENFNPKEAQKIIDKFIDRLKPWYKRPPALVAMAVVAIAGGIFIFNRVRS